MLLFYHLTRRAQFNAKKSQSRFICDYVFVFVVTAYVIFSSVALKGKKFLPSQIFVQKRQKSPEKGQVRFFRVGRIPHTY